MPRFPLNFGAGLDRETGIMAVRPTSFEDLRNVILFDGKATVRKGFEERLTFGSATHILAIQPVRSDRTMIVVTYDSATGNVDVWGADAAGTTATSIGTWFTKASDLTEPPVVSTTEVYARVFLAHAEPSVTRRADTYVYNRRESPQLYALTADLDRDDTAEPIKFRGVQRHLRYLTGWGYGSEQDTERSEILRVSKPGEPEVFDPEHYFIVGDRNAPIVACRPAFDTLLAFKEDETHQIFGYDRATFGQRMLDERFGCVGDRLAVAVSGLVFFWSSHGPRVTDGASPSRDAAIPLDYFGFDPETLVAQGDLEDAFAAYDPLRRVVLFVFGQRVYAMSIRGGLSRARWSYWEVEEFTPHCAGVVFQGDGTAFPAPTGFPTCSSLDGSNGTSLDYAWANNSPDGDEFIEIWEQEVANLKPDWELDTDGGSGVATGLVSSFDAAHTVNPSIDASAQKLELAASTAAATSYVYDDLSVTAGATYMLLLEARIANAVAGGKANITIEWRDASSQLSVETPVDIAGATFGIHKLEATAPVGAITARVRLQVESAASGDTIDAWFKRLLFFDSSAAWRLDQTQNVSTAATQSTVITPTNPGSFYRIRSRYGRGFEYTAGYTGDPDAWPDTSECYTLADPAPLVALFAAYWMSNSGGHNTRLLFAVTEPTWAAMEAAGASAGFRIELDDTGAGYAQILDLKADKSNPPIAGSLYTTDWKDVFHFGYDRDYAGETYKATLPVSNFGPSQFGVDDAVNELVWFEVDDLGHGNSAIDVRYRVTPYIGGTGGGDLDVVRYMGPEHEPARQALGDGPTTTFVDEGSQPTGGGPITLSASDAGTTNHFTATMTHSVWMWEFLQTCYCDQNGLCEVDDVDHFRAVDRLVVPQFLVQYRQPSGSGGWTDDPDGWQDCSGGGPGPSKLALSAKTVDAGATGDTGVRVKYRCGYNGNFVEGPPSDEVTVTVT